MTHILGGIQYRERKVNIPDWRDLETFQYNDWADVPEGSRNFASHTEFRIKPKKVYTLCIDGGNGTDYNSLATAVTQAQIALENGSAIDITPVEKSDPKLFSATLQVKRVGIRGLSDNIWQTVDWSKRVSYAEPVEFRLRPDHYYTVRHTAPNSASGLITFDDAVKLAEYVSNKIRTDSVDLQISKVKY